MAVLCIFLVVACYFDYHKGRIPNLLSVCILLYGLGYAMAEGGYSGILTYVGLSVPVILIFYPFFKIGCLGAGDVKLFGVCAGFFPPGKILLFLFFSLLISAVISLFQMLQKNNLKERFCYLGEYLLEVVKSGHFKLYVENLSKQKAGICLSGPVLCSVLLYWGGVY